MTLSSALSQTITSSISTLSSIWQTSVRERQSLRNVASTGPKPRDYSFKLNKKVKILARKSALSYKAKDNEIIVVDNFDMAAPKTKDFVNIAKNLKVEGKKTLVVLPEVNKNVYLSARNLQKAEIMSANNINTYKILNADVLVIAEASLEMINSVLNK